MLTQLLLLCSAAPAPQAPTVLAVASINVRFDNRSDPHKWEDRLPALVEILEGCDLIGTQEGLYHQVKDLSRALGKPWIGLGREGGSRGEFMAIFYDDERFEPLAYDHFWLSDTPRLIGSSSWGNEVRRMVTWVRFAERAGGREFVLLNTHFDHQVAEARAQSALQVRARIDRFPADLPVIVTGDFNAAAEASAPWRTLVEEGPLEDAWLTAEVREGPVCTFCGWGAPRPEGPRIDWILTRGVGRVERVEACVSRPIEGVVPSDHLPILARLHLGD